MKLSALSNRFCVQNQSHNQAIQSQDFCENQHQHHGDKEPWLVGVASDTLVWKEKESLERKMKKSVRKQTQCLFI